MPFRMLNLILLIIFGYLLGSIPSGLLISQAKGIDIRKVGSGNIGGTNVLRALGLKWAGLTIISDVFKGVVPAYLAIHPASIFGGGVNFFDWQVVLVAISPILGHVFPVWLKFKGGKGVATTIGALLILLEWKILLVWPLIWLLVLVTSKTMSFTNLLMVSFLPLAFWFSSFSLTYFIFGFILAILIWWTHRENLQRIKEGAEPKFKLKKSP